MVTTNAHIIDARRQPPLWTECEPSIRSVVRGIGLRREYDKSAIARALQNVLFGVGHEGCDPKNPDGIRRILSGFGIDRIRVDGDRPLNGQPCVITFTHFYSVLDILLLFYALGPRIGKENLVACGRTNTLRRLELGGRTLYDHFREHVIEIRQKHPGEPIVDLRETSQLISKKLSLGKSVMMACASGTQPLHIGLGKRVVSIGDVGQGFAYFASRAAVPVYSAAILIRPYNEAVVSLSGPHSVPERGYARVCEFAKEVVSSLEMRTAQLIAEEQHWTRLSQ